MPTHDPRQNRVIPRTGSNKTEYEEHDKKIITELVKVNFQQLNAKIPKYDPNYGITMKDLQDRTGFNRNTLRKHLLVGLKKTPSNRKEIQIYPPLLGTIVSKKNKRYFLEPAAKIFPVWEYLVNKRSMDLLIEKKIDFQDFFYKNAIVFIPNTHAKKYDSYDITVVPLAELKKASEHA